MSAVKTKDNMEERDNTTSILMEWFYGDKR